MKYLLLLKVDFKGCASDKGSRNIELTVECRPSDLLDEITKKKEAYSVAANKVLDSCDGDYSFTERYDSPPFVILNLLQIVPLE